MSDTDSQHQNDDWKARAAEERKKLQEKIDASSKEAHNLPPASFLTIMSTFATQAMVALGEMEIPGAEGRTVDLPTAKFAIDSLEVLKEKTKGNLDPMEEKGLEEVLQGLRLRFVKKSQEEGMPGTAG